MSERKNFSAELLIYIILFFVVIAAAFVIYPLVFQDTTNVRIGTASFNAKLALNEVDRLNGLNGVSELRYDEALLEVYPTESRWSVGMNDMKMPIDILWLNSNKQVISMVSDAKIPDGLSYKVFQPTENAKYILELPAGSIKARMIVNNSIVIFSIDESRVK